MSAVLASEPREYRKQDALVILATFAASCAIEPRCGNFAAKLANSVCAINICA